MVFIFKGESSQEIESLSGKDADFTWPQLAWTWAEAALCSGIILPCVEQKGVAGPLGCLLTRNWAVVLHVSRLLIRGSVTCHDYSG